MKALKEYMEQINAHLATLGEAPLDPYRDYADVRLAVEELGVPKILTKNDTLAQEEVVARTNKWLDAIAELDAIKQELASKEK